MFCSSARIYYLHRFNMRFTCWSYSTFSQHAQDFPNIYLNGRPLHTSCMCPNGNRGLVESNRQARMLKKFVTGSNKARKKAPYASAGVPVSTTLNEFGFMQKGKARPISGKVMRRVEVLNTLFIEQITSLLATGEVSPEFIGLGLQISKVKVSSDFSTVNVYWYASGTENDDKIENLLKRTAGHLRHTLSQLRVIGVVPPINFHQDRTFSKLQEVEHLLSKCDLGPPADNSIDTGGQDDTTQSDSESTEGAISDTELGAEEEMIDTRQDILGIKHALIMSQIINAVKQKRERKIAKEKKLLAQTVTDESIRGNLTLSEDTEPLEFADHVTDVIEDKRKRQSEFLKYLKQRQGARAKEMKRLSVEAKEQEFYMSEKEERYKTQLQNHLLGLDNDEESDDDDDDGDDYDDEKFYQDLRNNFR